MNWPPRRLGTRFPPQVVELQGGFRPAPIPPGYEQPPSRGLPQVEIVEPLNYLSAQGTSGAWGNNFTGEFPAEGASVLVASMDRFPGPPRPITVHLLRNDVDAPSAGNAMLRAVLTYGTGGAQNVAELDWCQGGQFTIVANAIRVEARAVRPFPDLPYAPDNTRIVLGASFGLEPASPARPPTFTAPYQPLFSPGSVRFPIPDFARRAYPLFASDGGGAAPFDVWQARFLLGDFTALVDVQCNTDIVQNGLIVPGFARYFSIFSATQTESVGAMFELGL